MKNKFKLVETEDYLLAVSDEDASNSYIYFTGNPTGIFKTGIKYKSGNGNYFYQDAITGMSDTYLTTISKKIIGYQPKGNAHELDLPLLPEIVVEDEVEKLAESYYTQIRLAERTAFKFGYKAATKVYSEEDLKKMFVYAHQVGMNTLLQTQSPHLLEKQDEHKLRDGFIQSLKQPKMPKWFVVECKTEYTEDGLDYQSDELKTTIINNKTYLVGTYLN
jgi:hypothetical protein